MCMRTTTLLVDGGYEITPQLESQTRNFLLNIQRDEIKGRLLSSITIVKRFRLKIAIFFQIHLSFTGHLPVRTWQCSVRNLAPAVPGVSL